MECKTCNKQTDYLEKHHIVPKSRGGLDIESNTIDICIECHNLAHDVNFKRKKGLISEGMQKALQKGKDAVLWNSENEKLIEKKFINMWKEDEDKAMFISYSLKYCNWSATEIKDFVLGNKVKLKCNV
jgi:hypothetical protein